MNIKMQKVECAQRWRLNMFYVISLKDFYLIESVECWSRWNSSMCEHFLIILAKDKYTFKSPTKGWFVILKQSLSLFQLSTRTAHPRPAEAPMWSTALRLQRGIGVVLNVNPDFTPRVTRRLISVSTPRAHRRQYLFSLPKVWVSVSRCDLLFGAVISSEPEDTLWSPETPHGGTLPSHLRCLHQFMNALNNTRPSVLWSLS